MAAPVAASEPPTAGTSPSAAASQPATTPPSSAPAGEPPTSAPSPAGADPATANLEREREAETISASWPSSLADEEPAAAELAQDLQNFIGQYQSLSHYTRPVSPGDSRAASRAPPAPELAPSSVQEEVSTMLVGSPVPTPDRAVTGGAPAPTGPAVSGVISRVISDPDGAATRFEPLAAMRRALRHGPVRSAESGTNLTVSSSLPSGAGTALGSGGGGLTAPSAALLVVAIACLLAARLLGRPAMRSLAWRSALLSLRLERPG